MVTVGPVLAAPALGDRTVVGTCTPIDDVATQDPDGTVNGSLAQNTHFDTAMRDDVTPVTEDVLRHHTAAILARGHVDDRVNGQVHQFVHDATVTGPEGSVAFAEARSRVRSDTASVPVPPGAVATRHESSDMTTERTFLGSTVDRQVTGTTTVDEESVLVTCEDALIIGDPNGDPASWTVTEGTVTIDTTITTVEVRHITETTTRPFDRVDQYRYQLDVVLSRDGAPASATAAAAPSPQPEVATRPPVEGLPATAG